MAPLRPLLRSLPFLLSLGSQLVTPAAAFWNCPIWGQTFPKAANMAQDPTIRAALDTIKANFDALEADNSTDTWSFSVEVFSGSTDVPLISRHHSAKNLAALNTTGVLKVDEHTVYRLGSLSKVHTIYALLVEIGDSRWNDPITKYVPELAEIAARGDRNPIMDVDWDEVTIGALASQISGIARDYSLLGEMTIEIGVNETIPLGFPPLPDVEVPKCGVLPGCNRTEYFAGFSKMPPSFMPYTTPAYSDISYQLLAYALENIKGRKFQDMIEQDLFQKLGLKDTYYAAPNDTYGVVPGDRWKSSWAYHLGEEAPTGNYYSSAADVSAIGRAILRSSLIKPTIMKRWLKPVSLSAEPKGAVGAPWGVRTILVPGQPNPYVSVTSFNKAGTIGRYTALLCVIPDLDIGFTVLGAGYPLPPGVNFRFADMLGNNLIPAVHQAARQQAEAKFGGRYEAVSVGNATTNLNSSIVITSDPQRPGLGVSRWISNAVDMLLVAVAVQGNVSYDNWGSIQPSARLYPTGLEAAMPAAEGGGGTMVGFKAVFENLAGGNVTALMSTDCATWIGVTAVVYGTKPLDQFVFSVDAAGKVAGLEIPALRTRYRRVGP